MSTLAASRKLRTKNINLRVTRNQKALIDRAATALGRSRSEFMLDAACQEAESVLLEATGVQSTSGAPVEDQGTVGK